MPAELSGERAPSYHRQVTYRRQARGCPGCRSMMLELPIPIEGDEPVAVDVCERCGGVFLEFFDGEPGALSRGVLERHISSSVENPTETAPLATPACPDCDQPMHAERYMKIGPEVARCPGCQSVFATRLQLGALATFSLPSAPEQGPQSLIDRLKSYFFEEEA